MARKWRLTIGAASYPVTETDFWLDYVPTENGMNIVLRGVWEKPGVGPAWGLDRRHAVAHVAHVGRARGALEHLDRDLGEVAAERFGVALVRGGDGRIVHMLLR